MIFLFVLIFYASYRVVELMISKRNEKLLNYPPEVGELQRYMMVMIHTLWFASMIVEYIYSTKQLSQNYFLIAVILLFCATIRTLSIKNLGKYWSTKIFDMPEEKVITVGLYKHFNQPNYAIVVFELILIPLLFNLRMTAISFFLINTLFLYFRIKKENIYLRKRIPNV